MPRPRELRVTQVAPAGHMHEWCPSGEQSDRNASLLTGLYENKPGWGSSVKRIQVATEKALQNHNNSRVVS